MIIKDETGAVVSVNLYGSASPDTPEDSQIQDYDGNIYSSVIIGNQEWMVGNLKTTTYADGTPINNITEDAFDDWFLPSIGELNAMYTELHAHSVGGFNDALYWSSTEDSATGASWILFTTGANYADALKLNTSSIRACRKFTSVSPSYSLRDIGPAGGLIFWKSGNDYLEAAPSDQSASHEWSNIQNQFIGTTSAAIGSGQANTTAIIGQVGHTNSAAKICDDLAIGGWVGDTIGAYCWLDNDINNKSVYGALYNWYAASSVHGLAPEGWRIPSETDINTLIAFLGGTTGGGKLKTTGLTYWAAPNAGATDEYGFAGVGGGDRGDDGAFQDEGFCLEAGTSTTSGAFWGFWALGFVTPNIDYQYGNKFRGFSIRCMRDVV
jgi:uncharacterized protein (TIGR02145 family)